MRKAATERSSDFEEEEISLLKLSKPKFSTQNKDTWAIDVSEISKLHVREKDFLNSSQGVCSKIMMFTVCKLLKKGWKTWTAFP